ncbi:hypothetical protein BCV73_28695 [Paenibacillus sp. SSG-1]|uniref:hypothetical protein n=1 Tax=Paenibacillus sp. SSG-1 TaxID=1443669 RepID=UPI000B7D8F55|nr:hypothetical protein [Paenibacillus sp. SSG-1]OXL86606.1 hypothetical protein BCV73_28695 [Paenibacillus sp. SSG-1]
MIGIWIVGCEIAFWVLVLAGLSVRYLAGWKKGGAALLLMTPVVDLLLIILTIMDLRGGAEAEFMHGLAAVYIGVTIAFGHRMIHWADERFAYRFGGGAKPQKAPKYGKAHARRERQGWFRHALAWVIGSILIFLMIVVVNDPERTEALKQVPLLWAWIVGIDFVISFSYTLWPRKKKGH